MALRFRSSFRDVALWTNENSSWANCRYQRIFSVLGMFSVGSISTLGHTHLDTFGYFAVCFLRTLLRGYTHRVYFPLEWYVESH